ncbi:MAG: radical SAM protein [Candidatus Omnitrophota bacterium]
MNIAENKRKMGKVALLRLKPPVFEYSYHPIGFRPPYILKYIEAFLKKEDFCDVKLIDQRITRLSFEDIVKNIKTWAPDIVVISISTLDVEQSLRFCRILREGTIGKSILIFGVGQEISADIEKYKDFNPLFDILLGGEAEIEIASIIRKINDGIDIKELKNFYNQDIFKTKLMEVSDPDSLPFPIYAPGSLEAYNFVYPLKLNKKVVWGHMLSSRGCPHHCIFCSQIMRESYGNRFRGRSATNVVDEMEHLSDFGANVITFDDDNFTSSRDHVKAICDEIESRQLKIKWIAHARIDEVDFALLKLMKKAGCLLLRFGIETGSKRVLEILSKTRNSGLWLKRVRHVIGRTRSVGIATVGLFIVGSPTETKDDLLESINFAKIISPDVIQVAYFIPFPGSSAYSLFKDQLKGIPFSKMYHYDKPLINLSAMSNGELEKAQSIFYASFLLRPIFVVKHIFNYLFFYLYNPTVFLELLGITRLILRGK